MPDAILTVPEAAKILKVSDKFMYTLTHRDDFPCIKLGTATRIPRDQFMSWIDAQATRKEN